MYVLRRVGGLRGVRWCLRQTAPVAGTSNSRMSGQITNLPRPLSHALHEWNNVIVNEIYFRVGSVAAAMMLFRILLAHSNSLMSSN